MNPKPIDATPTRRSDVQGLRAIAIGLVLVAHLGLPFAEGGYIGVDVFFVISGYLITGHLLSEIESTGRLRLGAFSARRIRRILPPALLVASVTTIAGLLWMPPLLWAGLGRMLLGVALFVPNILLTADGTDYLQNASPSPFQHFWSLGVEEQFYLVWPVVLLLAFRLGRRSLGALLIVVTGLTAASLVASIVLLDVSTPWTFFLLPTRAWEFGVGALLAIALRHSSARGAGQLPVWAKTPVVGLGLALILIGAFAYTDETRFPALAAVVPVAGAAFVILGGTDQARRAPLQRLLELRPVAYVGRVSYSLYLWHWPLLVIPQAAIGLTTPLPVSVKLGLLAASFVLADATYRLVERPLARSAVTANPKKTAVVAAIAVLTVCLASFVPSLAASRVSLATQTVAAPVAVGPTPSFTPLVPANLRPALAQAAKSTSSAHRNGCHIGDHAGETVNECVFGDPAGATSVALFGDSHAAHWLPALDAWAKPAGVRVESYTKAGCASAFVSMDDHGRDFASCTRWRSAVVDRLTKHPVDLVVVANTNGLEFRSRATSREEQWDAGITRLRSALPPATRMLGLANTPKLGDDAPVCLSNHLDAAHDCGAPRSVAIDSSWQRGERRAFEGTAESYADLTDYFCSVDRCDPIIGDTLVYRDQSHLTEVWSTGLAEALGNAVSAALEGQPGQR